jgi:hypothetical protein
VSETTELPFFDCDEAYSHTDNYRRITSAAGWKIHWVASYKGALMLNWWYATHAATGRMVHFKTLSPYGPAQLTERYNDAAFKLIKCLADDQTQAFDVEFAQEEL